MQGVKNQKFIRATGKKKTSIASVILRTHGSGSFTINGVPLKDLNFNTFSSEIIMSPFVVSGFDSLSVDIVIKAIGGGISSQLYAIRHAISIALSEFDLSLRSSLKSVGFLTRDSRIVERKKPGLRKARKSEQYSKR
jgi:small subunit ribosomal protein S9